MTSTERSIVLGAYSNLPARDLEPFARETLSPETLRRQGYLDPAAVTRVRATHVSGRDDLSRPLWGLLAFTLWFERHVEGIRRDVELESVVMR